MRCYPRFAAVLSFILLAAGCATHPTPAERAVAAATTAWPRIGVPGGEIEYQVSGIGEPLLLIHGSVYADVFDAMRTQPALSTYQIINYHRRGYAGSTRVKAPFTIQQHAADALALLDNLRIRRAHVLGHSTGGSVALQMAKQAPERVGTLLLFEAAVPSLGTIDPTLMQAVTAALERYGKGDRRGAIRTFGEAVAPGSFDEMVAAGATAMIDQAVADAPTFFEVELPALQQWQYGTTELGALRIPALVVAGQLTPAGFRSGHHALLKGIAGSEELVVRGVGHQLQMKEPRLVAEGVAAFLRRHPLKQ